MMNKIFFLMWVLCSSNVAFSQDLKVDSLGFKTFEMKEGDTTYVMKQYFMAFLHRGENLTHDEEEAAAIQAAHLAHMDSLAKLDMIDIAGPFGDDGDLRGIVIYNVPTSEKAKALTQQDPAVKAGRLNIVVRPWWAAVGSKLK